MGIRITSTTWRTPLQLIDSWLPAPSPSCQTRRTASPWLQRFAKAGWLGRNAQPAEIAPRSSIPLVPPACPATVRAAPVRIVRPPKTVRGNTRLVIAGRMADVCAELDRLAALEQPSALV
ncbi:hypothetical protein [Hydrogenophaga sp. RWCD_12]|uniref:hypothetical protein n=1 Tax=Hydrogenophaga sp. RWCD_12 TaxID=3391190 RepID=UPI00398490DF